ncbi:hypothetical protein OHB26_00245 [Nocardia sp. NBC_01503]|uniref:TPR repeat region-containing protein n=1 Tax=Nocardia sp. NBC_01503 TaxID=2975997 RepID=UPI002E7B7E85|nr:hypothetical protein [Nocardia sp. NBC_01503]WTL32745.1 hypothetical protein OHB26_00245 [Nocardia sp. NBC_01503]
MSQVISWKLDTLEAQGRYWTEQSGKVTTQLDAVYNDADKSADYIVGKFGNAVRSKSLTVRDEGYKIANALTAAGAVVVGRLEGLQTAQSIIAQSKSTITAEGYLVAEDGSVVLSLSQIANALSDRDNAAVKLAALQRKADDYATSLRWWLDEAGTTAQVLADGVTAAFAELPGGANGAAPVPVTAASGQDLGTKVKNSDQIPADVLTQIDQVLDKTGLSADDLARIKAGEPVDVPASTLEFTQKLLDAAGPEGFSRLSEQLRTQGPNGETHARELANSVMVLSNENVKGIKADGKQTTGGYEQLPQSYRD